MSADRSLRGAGIKPQVLRAVKYLVISLFALLILIPVWDMVINSFKTAEASRIPNVRVPDEWRIVENYGTVIRKAKVLQSFKNSLIITSCSVALTLAVSTAAAYVFGRRKERRIRLVFFLFMIGIMTPPSMILTVMMLKYLNLLGSYLGIILFYAATYCPLPIFLISGFMTTVPLEIEESAIMDGVDPFRLFTGVVLPLLKPAIATSFIYILLKVWNDFLYPIFVLAGNTRRYTMVLGLYFFKGQFYTQWNLVFAFLVLVSLPVLVAFIFAQKQIAEGLTAGAVKG